MAKSVSESKEIEFESDAWERFERAMAVVVKSPPQHRVKKVKRKPKATSARSKRGSAS